MGKLVNVLDFIKISISCALAFSVAACASHGLPKIERDSNKTARLVVEGKPFVVLGGELLNSSGSTASDMQKHWDGLADLNLNTVLLAVAWEQIEKSEGVLYDRRIWRDRVFAVCHKPPHICKIAPAFERL